MLKLSLIQLNTISVLDGIGTEHIIYVHPVITGIVFILFNWILLCAHVPSSFCYTYTVPIPKDSDSVNRLHNAQY